MKKDIIKIDNNGGKYQTIIGQCHFINTLFEIEKILKKNSTNYGIGYSEASDYRKIFVLGNEKNIKKTVLKNINKIFVGHIFLIQMDKIFPKKITNELKNIPEVVSLLVATGNPINIIINEITKDIRMIIGISDGLTPVNGIASEKEIEEVREFISNLS